MSLINKKIIITRLKILLREVLFITQDTQEKIYRWGKGVSSFFI